MNDLLGYAMELEHMIAIQPGHAFQSDGGVGEQNMNLLGEEIHHHTDGILSLRFQQFFNQVISVDLLRLRRDVMR